MEVAAQPLVQEITSIHRMLSSLPNLAPGREVNSLLSRLVDLCTAYYSEAFADYVLSLPIFENMCAALQPMCATAEGELEMYWAERMLQDSRERAGMYYLS